MRKISWLVTLILFAFAAPFSIYAAEDMWVSVYRYQKKLAEHGNPQAQVKLGEMYEEGHGVEKSYDTAEEWYRKAETQGHKPADLKLKSLVERRLRDKTLAEKRQAEVQRLEQERKQQVDREAREREQRAFAENKRQEREARKRAGKEREMQKAVRNKEREYVARQRAAEAMKKMLEGPSAYEE